MAVRTTLPPDVAAGQRRRGTWPVGTLAWLTAAVSLVLAANVRLSRALIVDSYYDLYAGRYLVRHGIPHRNLVTIAAHGAPWIDQQWLAHIAYYAAFAAGGYPAVAALSAALVTAGFAVLALTMARRGVPATRMFAWTITAFAACLGNTQVRAQSFGYLFFAVTLWLVLDDSDSAAPRPPASWPRSPRPRARTWLVLPVLVLWANTHGSVLLGAALVGGYAACRAAIAARRRCRTPALAYLVLAAAACAAVLCTPYGTATAGYYLRFGPNSALDSYVAEWAPSLNAASTWIFLGAAAAVLTAAAVSWRRGARPDPLLAALAVGLLGLALTAARDEAWFGLAGSLLAADALARAGGSRVPVLSAGFRRTTAAALGALAAASLAALAVRTDLEFESQAPVRAIQVAAAVAARQNDPAVLGDDYSGTAALWLAPELTGRVGFDCRFEFFSATELGAYFDFVLVRGHHWQRASRGYSVIVAASQRAALVRALIGLPGWRVAYHGRDGVVLVRMPAR
ncbi:MAG TPA: hypothetical protein VNF47_26250 [Streptosporangiaceae bacterium]|nr:hypothetical protein [Streptosporangiaceae bacterium]